MKLKNLQVPCVVQVKKMLGDIPYIDVCYTYGDTGRFHEAESAILKVTTEMHELHEHDDVWEAVITLKRKVKS